MVSYANSNSLPKFITMEIEINICTFQLWEKRNLYKMMLGGKWENRIFFHILSILSGLSVCLEEFPLPVHSFISFYCPYGGNINPCTHNLNIKRDESFSQAVNKGKLSINLMPVTLPLFPSPKEGNLWLKLKRNYRVIFCINIFFLICLF